MWYRFIKFGCHLFGSGGSVVGVVDGGAEFIGAVGEGELADDFFEVAVENLFEAVEGQADAVVGDAALVVVVGTDLFGAVTGADLGAAFSGDGAGLLLLFDLQEAALQDGHGFGAVFVLGAFVLAGDDEPGGQVRDADGGVGTVDVLAAGAGCAVGVDFKLSGVDVDFDFVDLRKHGYGDGGGVDSAAGFGDGHALDAVDAAFVFEAAVGAAAFDGKDQFLVAAEFGVIAVDVFDLPALADGVGSVHFIEVRYEERGFFPTRTGTDLHDDGTLVFGVFDGEKVFEVFIDGLKFGFEGGYFFSRHLAHLFVVGCGVKFFCIGKLAGHAFFVLDAGDDGLEVA